MLHARWVCMSGEEKLRMPHCAWAGKPWIDENGKIRRALRRIVEGIMAGKGREGQEKGGIGVEMLDRHGHLVGWTMLR